MKSQSFKIEKVCYVTIVSIVVITFWSVLTFGDSVNVKSSESNRSLSDVSASKESAVSFNSDTCLRTSIRVIEKLLSFSTEMKLELNLFGERFQGIAEYSELSLRRNQYRSQETNVEHNQLGSEKSYVEVRNPLEWNVFRLKVKLLLQNSKASDPNQSENCYIITSDRRALWKYSKIEGVERLQQINIEDLSNHLARLSDNEKRTLMKSGVESPCGMSGLPGLGGMAGLMKGIVVNYDFQKEALAGRLGKEYPVWKLTGKMKKEVRESLEKRLLDYNVWGVTKKYIEFLPTDIEILMSQESVFPCMITYYCTKNDEKQVLMKISFNNIHFNDIREDIEDFTYETPNKTYEEFGEEYLKRLIPGIEL